MAKKACAKPLREAEEAAWAALATDDPAKHRRALAALLASLEAGRTQAIGEIVNDPHYGVQFNGSCEYGAKLPVGAKVYLVPPMSPEPFCYTSDVVIEGIRRRGVAGCNLWRKKDGSTNVPLYLGLKA